MTLGLIIPDSHYLPKYGARGGMKVHFIKTSAACSGVCIVCPKLSCSLSNQTIEPMNFDPLPAKNFAGQLQQNMKFLSAALAACVVKFYTTSKETALVSKQWREPCRPQWFSLLCFGSKTDHKIEITVLQCFFRYGNSVFRKVSQ